jgi:hypothetical protein
MSHLSSHLRRRCHVWHFSSSTYCPGNVHTKVLLIDGVKFGITKTEEFIIKLFVLVGSFYIDQRNIAQRGSESSINA